MWLFDFLKSDFIIIVIMSIIMGILEIRYAYKHEDNRIFKLLFIIMGISTIALGIFLFIINYIKL